MRAALDDLAALEHQDLIGAPNRREPVRDHERRPPLPQRLQAVLDQRLALAVEARRRLVEDQDPRVGQDRARDRHPLALAAGQPHAALADDRVVPLLERLDELVAVRDPADRLDLVARRVRPGVRDVLGDRAVEQEVVLQHDAEVRPVVAQRAPSVRSWPSTSTRPEVGRLKAITRLISVLLPDPLDPTSAVVEPAGAWNETCFSTGTPGLYSKLTSSNVDLAANVRQRRAARVFLIFGRHRPDLADAIEAGERLGQLRADRRELDDRHGHHRGEGQIHHQIADASSCRCELRAPPISIMAMPLAPITSDENAITAETPVIDLRDVPEQAVRALGEHQLFALLGGVGLDDADAAERFGEAAGDFRVDLAALAEQRAAAA